MQNQKTVKDVDLQRPRVGVDLLGCDTPGHLLLKSLVETSFDDPHPPLFTLFGTQDIFDQVPVPKDFHCHVVNEWIESDEAPLKAIKKKKGSSLVLGINQLKSYDLDAFISAGNTGALLAAATLTLPLLPGITRPALLTLIPTKKEPIAVLDVGANINFKAENLLQYAKMGIAYQKARGITHPKVGLLNIGTEKQKGTPEIQKAYKLLDSLNTNAPFDNPVFMGNIEGRDVFHGQLDVLITDGFTGNVFLKTSEGIAGFVLDQMQKLGPIESLPGLRSIIEPLKHRLHYAGYPGALLCGVDGVIIKCHGESTPTAFINSIKGASRLITHFFLEKLKNEL